MDISIIVPTYNRKIFLENCLKSLFNQTYPKNQYEIIVVDDGSTDGTREMIKRLKTDSNLRYFYQENQGPAAARNLGIKNAKGKIIAFIDSDCLAFPDWLRIIALSFKKPAKAVGGIGGPSVARFYPQNLIARIDQAILNYFIHKFKKGKEVFFLPTSNLSFKKEIFTVIGDFDLSFNREAGEDTEFAWRLKKNGYKLIYEPKMRVEHLQRSTLGSFLLQNFYYGRGIYLVKKKHPDFGNVQSDPLADLQRYFHELFIFPIQFTRIFPRRLEKIMALFLSFLRQIVFFLGIIAGKVKYG